MITSQLLECLVVYIRFLCLCCFLNVLSSEVLNLNYRHVASQQRFCRPENWVHCTKKIIEKYIQRIIHFYRAMPMHSADCAVARCLSVCLSHASIVSKR